MKTFSKIFVALILVCALAAGGIYYYLFLAGDKTPLQQMVPSDALAYADIKESRKLALEIATSGQAAAFIEMGKIVSGLFAFVLNAETADPEANSLLPAIPSLQWEALFNASTHFYRQVAVFALESEIEALPFHAYAIAHFQGDAEDLDASIRRFLDSANQAIADAGGETEPLSIQSETIDGQAIRYIALPQAGIASAWEIHPSWTVIDGRFVFGLNPDSLAEYLNTLRMLTPDTSLESKPDFGLAVDYQPQLDGQAYMNMDGLVKAVSIFANETIGAMVSQAGISIDQVIEALGLRELETSFYAYDFDATSSLLTQGVTYRERKGMLSLYSDSVEIERPLFIPSSSYTSGSMAMDVGEFILTTKDIVLQVAPLVALMYPNYKQIADQQLGQDVETFARETFTDEFHTFGEFIVEESEAGEAFEFGQSQTYVAGLTNGETFKALLDEQLAPFRAMGLLNLIDEDVAGFTMSKLAGEEDKEPTPFAYAIADNKLFVGYGAGKSALKSMKTSLALLASNQAGASQSPQVSEYILANRENAVQVSLLDLGILVGSGRQLAKRIEANAKKEGDTTTLEALNSIDWEAFENLDIKLVNVVNEEKHLFISRLRSFAE